MNEEITELYRKAVLITGCDSGFGHHLAKRLDTRGFRVFASCLFPEGLGAKELKRAASKNLQILELNVTKDNHVEEALKFVKNNLGPTELWAVVNNAGIHKGLSVELTDIDEFETSMDVNTYGLLKVTKAFLPLIRQSKGRIVNVTSPGGRMGMPYFAPYCMSKHAAVGFTDCLRQEMEQWGVKVVSIEPEGFQTAIATPENVTQVVENTITRLDKNIRADYGETFLQNIIDSFKRRAKPFKYRPISDKIHKVIDDMELAVTKVYPESVYRPCRNGVMNLILNVILSLPISCQDAIMRKSFSFIGIDKSNESD